MMAQKKLGSTNVIDLRLKDEDRRSRRQQYKIFSGKILSDQFPAFDFLTGVFPTWTLCQYEAEMALQSVVVPMLVLINN